MSKYMVLYEGMERGVFDTEEEAQDHIDYLIGCAELGAEILHMSNPGDYDNKSDISYNDFEIIEID